MRSPLVYPFAEGLQVLVPALIHALRQQLLRHCRRPLRTHVQMLQPVRLQPGLAIDALK